MVDDGQVAGKYFIIQEMGHGGTYISVKIADLQTIVLVTVTRMVVFY